MIDHLADRVRAVDRAADELHADARPDPVSLLLTNQQHSRIREAAGRLAEAAAAIAGGEYRPPFLDWRNHETGAAALLIDNDAGLADAALERVRDALAEIPEHWKEEPTPYAPDIAAAVRAGQLDVAGAALRDMFDAIAEHELDDDAPARFLGLPPVVRDAFDYAQGVTDWPAIAAHIAERNDLP